MSTTLKALSKKRAASDDEADAPATKKPIQNKQRVLVLSSRGVTERYRHLMSDLQALLPHTKKGEYIVLIYTPFDATHRLKDQLKDVTSNTQ